MSRAREYTRQAWRAGAFAWRSDRAFARHVQLRYDFVSGLATVAPLFPGSLSPSAVSFCSCGEEIDVCWAMTH